MGGGRRATALREARSPMFHATITAAPAMSGAIPVERTHVGWLVADGVRSQCVERAELSWSSFRLGPVAAVDVARYFFFNGGRRPRISGPTLLVVGGWV